VNRLLKRGPGSGVQNLDQRGRNAHFTRRPKMPRPLSPYRHCGLTQDRLLEGLREPRRQRGLQRVRIGLQEIIRGHDVPLAELHQYFSGHADRSQGGQRGQLSRKTMLGSDREVTHKPDAAGLHSCHLRGRHEGLEEPGSMTAHGAQPLARHLEVAMEIPRRFSAHPFHKAGRLLQRLQLGFMEHECADGGMEGSGLGMRIFAEVPARAHPCAGARKAGRRSRGASPTRRRCPPQARPLPATDQRCP